MDMRLEVLKQTDIAKFLYEMGLLKRTKRSGWWVAGVSDPESVAEHSFRTAIIGYILAHLEHVDPLKTILMCLFHDSHEARLNDLHKIGRQYIDRTSAKEKAFLDQITRLPEVIFEELSSIRYDLNGPCREAEVAHDADLLECFIQAREYQIQGCKEAGEWVDNNRSSLSTISAKRIAEECLKLEPKEWWKELKFDDPGGRR